MTRKVWAVLMTRGPQRGTWAHQIGGIFAALVLGLVFWWSRIAGG